MSIDFQFPTTIQNFVNKYPELTLKDTVHGPDTTVYFFEYGSLRVGISLTSLRYKHMSFSIQRLAGLIITRPTDEQIMYLVKDFFGNASYREFCLRPKIRQFIDSAVPRAALEVP